MTAAPIYQDSRRVRLVALLGIVAALVLVRAEASQAALALGSADTTFEVSALEGAGGGSLACASAGPCFFLSVEVRGSGSVSTVPPTDPQGTIINCPSTCTTPNWFIWGFDFPDPFIELAHSGNVSWLPGPGQDQACHAIVSGRCRIHANQVSGDGSWCVIAQFPTGSTVAGGCSSPTPQPAGEPLVVQKWGSGTGTVTSFSTAEPGQREINCGNVCSSVYLENVEVTLQKFPVSGSKFAGWTGTNLPSTCTTPPTNLNNCKVQITNKTITARAKFDLINPPKPKPLDTRLFIKPPQTTRKRQATFGWRAEPTGVPFKSQCKLNKQIWKSCTSPKTYSKLKPGRFHTVRIRVRHRNNSAPWDPKPAVWTWRVRR